MTARLGDWCQTATGGRIWPLDARVGDACIEDIALSLAKTCRFNGHLRRDVWHYSTAQHSVLVSYACAPEHASVGLMHDAAEFAVQDLTRPLKRSISAHSPVYALAEQQWAIAIGGAFGLADKLCELPEDVKRADEAVLATEQRDLMEACEHDWRLRERPLPERIDAWDAHTSYVLFMRRFAELFPDHAQKTRLGCPEVT